MLQIIRGELPAQKEERKDSKGGRGSVSGRIARVNLELRKARRELGRDEAVSYF
jgi:hypothetical protein